MSIVNGDFWLAWMCCVQHTCGAKSPIAALGRSLPAPATGFMWATRSFHQERKVSGLYGQKSGCQKPNSKPQKLMLANAPSHLITFLKPFGCRTLQGDERWPEQQLPCPLCLHWDVNQKLPRGTYLQCTRRNKNGITKPCRSATPLFSCSACTFSFCN